MTGDFALVFYMAHEVPDVARFMQQVAEALAPGGELLLVEPKVHVTGAKFAATVKLAEAAGLYEAARPRVVFSRAALLEKPQTGQGNGT